MLMPVEHVRALLVIASQLSGYPIPANAPPLPPVVELTSAEMAKEACGDDTLALLSCSVLGFYEFPDSQEGEHLEIVRDDPDHSADAIAVHELTHWLQWHNWPNPSENICPREFNREYEAYTVGFKYEHQYEGKEMPKGFHVPPVGCPLKP